MHEGLRSAEAPKLTPFQNVVKETLYVNLRYPQTGLGLTLFSARAIAGAEDPEALFKEFETSELSDKDADEFIKHANRAHAAFLPPGQIPAIDASDMQDLWLKDVRTQTNRFFYDLGVKPGGEAPAELFTVVKGLTEAAVAAFKSERCTALLKEYRESQADPDRIHVGSRRSLLSDQIRREMLEAAAETARAHPEYDAAIVKKFFDHFYYKFKP